MYKRARKRKKKTTQKGGALPFAGLLPFTAKALPWTGKAALGGAASFGSSKILGKIFGGGKKKPYIEANRFYLGGKKLAIGGRRLYLGGKKPAKRRRRKIKQRGGFFPLPAFYIAKKLVKNLM